MNLISWKEQIIHILIKTKFSLNAQSLTSLFLFNEYNFIGIKFYCVSILLDIWLYVVIQILLLCTVLCINPLPIFVGIYISTPHADFL